MKKVETYEALFKHNNNNNNSNSRDGHKDVMRELSNDIKELQGYVIASIGGVLGSVLADSFDIGTEIYQNGFDYSMLSSPNIAPIMTGLSLTLMGLLIKKRNKYENLKNKNIS